MRKDWASHFAPLLGRMCADLEGLVRLESPSEDAERVTRLAAWVRDRLRERGVDAETRPCPPRGEALLAGVGRRRGGTLLLGHLDTVWPAGTLASFPFGAQDDQASGPGVFDMKAGIAVGMAAMAALARETLPSPVRLLLVPDEEVGTAASRELLLAVARRHDQVLVLEPSLNGAAKLARKGTALYEIAFAGRAAHAGLEPEKGASALAELSRFVLFAGSLGNADEQTTVTPTLAAAGEAANVVPERARLTLDVRVWSEREAERVERALREYRSADASVYVSVEGGLGRPPMEPTVASRALYERARRIAREHGWELGAARVGGASDGNLTAAAGIPTLDGLGPMGGGAHGRKEHVYLSDLPRRAALVASLVSED
jgi:glutamate carboxypeptidase